MVLSHGYAALLTWYQSASYGNQNPRFNKGKGFVADVHGNSMSPGDDEHRGTHNDTSPQLTREQYAQFLELLQQLQVQKHGDTNSNTLLHTSPNHSTNLPTAIQPPNSIHRPEPTAPTRPSRSHKLPTYLQDYVLSKNMKVAPSVDTPNQLQNSNISLNAAFSKHQHIPPEVLADESQALVHPPSDVMDDIKSLHSDVMDDITMVEFSSSLGQSHMSSFCSSRRFEQTFFL
ncbi:hypothetical protein H5410_017370 [Solanum commersonii]|uniref:Uncharacterized protein n=1 Tax=Solanum commersonii TaxID=4109 RepID=A0A9J5ZZT0_SOLCO|nr:hypothetical protein H5410_017370 [Solanum commersonii]